MITTAFTSFRNLNDLAGIFQILVPLLAVVVLAICFWADTVDTEQIINTTINVAGDNSTCSDNDVDRHVVPISTSATASDYIMFPWFVQLLGCCSMFILTRFNFPIPYAAVMFMVIWMILHTTFSNIQS